MIFDLLLLMALMALMTPYDTGYGAAIVSQSVTVPVEARMRAAPVLTAPLPQPAAPAKPGKPGGSPAPAPAPVKPVQVPQPQKTLLVFVSDTCPPCKQLKKYLETHRINANIIYKKAGSPEATSYRVRMVPTVYLLDGNKVIKSTVGYSTDAAFNRWLSQ